MNRFNYYGFSAKRYLTLLFFGCDSQPNFFCFCKSVIQKQKSVGPRKKSGSRESLLRLIKLHHFLNTIFISLQIITPILCKSQHEWPLNYLFIKHLWKSSPADVYLWINIAHTPPQLGYFCCASEDGQPWSKRHATQARELRHILCDSMRPGPN